MYTVHLTVMYSLMYMCMFVEETDVYNDKSKEP